MYDFKKVEHDIAHFWKEQDIFTKSLENTRKGKRFVFWEGPPTANGMPHTGHFLTRIYKDLYGRYKTMRGFFVLRKAGWDTHGLPVEIEIEKELGFKNKKQIEEYGIAKFNRKCRESVWKYKGQWEEMSRRMGFWLDMKNPYITYETNYTESVWNILSEIWKKGLLYKAHKIIPFCVRCGTGLSAHEVAQGYKTVTDTSVYVKFRLKSDLNTYILAWTTTPWTLPGNVALAVGADIKYSYVKQGSETFIIASELIEKVLGSTVSAEKEVTGRELVGLEYQPLFEVPELKSDKSYRVYDADFVSTTDGTGVVHTAVMYGEDDYNLGTKLELPKFHTVNEQGHFIDSVGDGLGGKYVKSKGTEDLIIQKLTEKNLLFKSEQHEHEYPHCWRCQTPLLYYAKSSWFIKTSALNQQMMANNATVNWIPEHVKDGRFGQWLKEGKDWALSRERYWGTPLPIWECGQCDHKTTIGSIKELEKLSVGSKNTYYVMRHGLTTRRESSPDAIINSNLQNSEKYHLTEEGMREVEQSLELLKMSGIDCIFASPFTRTKETAEIAAKVLHKKYEIDDRLHEVVCTPESEEKLLSDFPQHVTETPTSIRERLASFMVDMESKHKNKKILIITHGDLGWYLQTIGQGLTATEMNENPLLLPYSMLRLAEIKKVDWRKIPRNEYGELDLHRPFIDEVVLKCPQCKSKMRKVLDLIDVWFDSGAMPYAQWHFPFDDKKVFKNQFPADFIVEGMDQTRGWFYTLLAISTLLDKGAPYKNVMALGFTLDEKGVKESKSKGNYVPVPELMEKHGVDVLRWFFASGMTIGENKAVVGREIDDKLKGFFFTLQNCIRFYELYKNEATELGKLTQLDKWLLSRYNRILQSVTEKLDRYDVTPAGRELEEFVIEDLSNWWVRRSRKRKEALPLLRMVLLDLARVLAPFTPFMAEDMYRRLGGAGESVHLAEWPKVAKKYLDEKLETEMSGAREAVTKGLAIRKEKQVKVRQPLATVTIKRAKFSRDVEALIKDELNIKKIKYDTAQTEDVVLDLELTPALVREGYARELMRMIQDMRKEAKYRMDDMVTADWHSSVPAVLKTLEGFVEDIKKDTMLSSLEMQQKGGTYDIEKESELAPGKTIWLGLKK